LHVFIFRPQLAPRTVYAHSLVSYVRNGSSPLAPLPFRWKKVP